MRCAECDRLRAQVHAQLDELAAWRANDRDDLRIRAGRTRLARWQTALKASPQVVGVMMMLADENAAIVTRAEIVEATRSLPGVAADCEPSLNLASVVICKARAVLEGFGLTGVLQHHRGVGWSMTVSGRHQVLALVGERP